MTRKGKYSLELKVLTVKKHREERVPIRILAAELGAAETTVRRWVSHTSMHGGPDASFRHREGCECISCFRRQY